MKPNGCKVLMVDDEVENRELICSLLEQRGYTVSTAEHGAQGLSLLEAGLDPDLILTDLQMPVMSGWEFCEALKRSPAWRSIPVVVLCAMSPEQRGKLQVEGTFVKGSDLATLLNRIAELCGV